MFDKILIVCIGNICRSPTGERLLQKYLPNKIVDSAGISALTGYEADDNAISVAAQNDLSLQNHCAKQLTKELCRNYDLILVMEKKHIQAVCKLVPEARGKVMLFGHWTSQEISDPYHKSLEAFQATYILLDNAAHKWASKLS
ncbi:arsenate reductase/protein-tyrosine-phosphatase family protein [Acerihabitans arboris]|uniref:protein-tyrosine-phosphatase n=1 Tax=Acerihabitans arboris TaxID=2691583 RepID=A0A845SM46_9GAMM|nr:protein tyrosine phosphatase [Acerihabitans arboris]NDL62335.1 protein tyrosine phosphatase [Acerihabitans arboris]